MASPQPGYEQQAQQDYSANPQDHASIPAASAPGKKKRHYAGQAYEFGGGANAALGGQQVGGAQYPPQPMQQNQGYGSYNQQSQQQPGYSNQAHASGPSSPAFGGPTYGQQPQTLGGYQSPEPAYPAQGAPQHPSVGGITQGMGNVSMGQSQQPPMQGRNQLYPSDITNTPLNVNELDLPPPPIILPPNVSPLSSRTMIWLTKVVERDTLTRC